MGNTAVVVSGLIGSAVGVFSGLNEGFGVAVLFGCIGAVAGVAIGGAVARVDRRIRRSRTCVDTHGEPVTEQASQDQNYWLDRGRLTAAPGLPHADDTDPHSREP